MWSTEPRRVVRQGDFVRRPSRLRLHVDGEKRIFVSGVVVELGRGIITVWAMVRALAEESIGPWRDNVRGRAKLAATSPICRLPRPSVAAAASRSDISRKPDDALLARRSPVSWPAVSAF